MSNLICMILRDLGFKKMAEHAEKDQAALKMYLRFIRFKAVHSADNMLIDKLITTNLI